MLTAIILKQRIIYMQLHAKKKEAQYYYYCCCFNTLAGTTKLKHGSSEPLQINVRFPSWERQIYWFSSKESMHIYTVPVASHHLCTPFWSIMATTQTANSYSCLGLLWRLVNDHAGICNISFQYQITSHCLVRGSWSEIMSDIS